MDGIESGQGVTPAQRPNTESAVDPLTSAKTLFEACEQSLQDTLASITALNEDHTRLLLDTLAPQAETLLSTTGVIEVVDGRTLLTFFGVCIAEYAHERVEAEDPDGTRRRQAVADSRTRVLGRVAQARAATQAK